MQRYKKICTFAKKIARKLSFLRFFLYYLIYICRAYHLTIIWGFYTCIVYALATVMTADSARFGILNGGNSRENYRSHARMLKSKVRIGFKITTKHMLLEYHPNTRLWLPNRKPHNSRYSKMHLWRLICHNESLWFKHIERCICHVVLSYQFLLLLSDKSYNPLKSTQDVSKYDIYSHFLYHILSLCA